MAEDMALPALTAGEAKAAMAVLLGRSALERDLGVAVPRWDAPVM